MLNNKGQSLIGILIVLVVVGVITGGVYYYLQRQIPEIPEVTEKSGEEEYAPEEKVVEPEKEIIPSSGKETTLQEETSPNKGTVSVCKNECSKVGLKGCSDNGYQVCGNHDSDTCLEWGPVVSCSEGTSCVMGNCMVFTPPQEEVEYWAVTFGASTHGGGGNALPAFDNSPLVLKDILVQHGWKEDHIKYFAGENTTYVNVITALDWLADNTGPNDMVLFYSMTHGSSDGIGLSDRFLEFSKLAEKLDKVRYGGMLIITEACYSGSAIPFLKKENRVIMTSTRSNELGVNAVFGHRVLAALQGFGDIEKNNNGWVSAEEAFNFAQTRYNPQNTPYPQIQDDYPGELNILFLDGYWRYLDQFNIEKGKSSFTGSNYLGGNPLEDEVRIYAQSFKPDYPILTKAMLGVYFGSGKPGPLTVSVRKDLLSSDLTSATLNQDVIRPFSSELYEFDFPDIEVIPNETYYLVIKVSYAVEKDDYYNLWVDNAGDYPEGSYSRGTTFFKGISPSVPWTDVSPVDLYFATFGKPK